MKYLGLILVLALVAGQVLAFRINENDSSLEHSRPKRSLNDKVRDFLENIKITLREGNDTLGIPVMDPFVSKEINIAIDEFLVNGTAQLRDFKVLGLADYTVDKAEIQLLARKITIGLTWPEIYADGSYKFDIAIADTFDAFGDGKFTLKVHDLSFVTTVKLALIGGVRIKEIKTEIHLGGLELEATGLFDDEELSKMISAAITDMAPELIEDYQTELTDAVNEKVTNFVNKQLEGKSLADIIAILG